MGDSTVAMPLSLSPLMIALLEYSIPYTNGVVIMYFTGVPVLVVTLDKKLVSGPTGSPRGPNLKVFCTSAAAVCTNKISSSPIPTLEAF